MECLDTLLPSFTAHVNSSLSSAVFLEVFKTALVTPLLKKKSLDQNELKNYRPVSDLSFVSKIIEKLVLSRLSDYLSVDWLSSYLTNRTQSDSIHCYTFEPAPISFGVPQGSVLGPVLFVLNTAPLSTVIEKHSVLHHSHTDDSQLQKSAPPHQILDLFLSMRKCIDEIKSWMTLNLN